MKKVCPRFLTVCCSGMQEHIARIVTEHRVAIQFDQNWLEDLYEKIIAEMFGVCTVPVLPVLEAL